MPVVPTSQVRVVPQAPRVDIGAFIPPPNPTGGMDLFANAAKLPLMFEQIALEKDRNKLEGQKIKLAEKEAQYMADNYERIKQAEMQAADFKRREAEAGLAGTLLKNAALAIENEQNAPATGETIAGAFGANVAAEEAPLAGETGVAAEEMPASPLAAETPQFNVMGNQPVAAAAQAAPAPKAPEDFKFPLDLSNFSALPNVRVVNGSPDYNPIVDEELRKRTLMYLGGNPTNKAVREVQKEQYKWREELKPTPTEDRKTDANGIPVVIPVVKVGDRVVDIIGEPRIDIKTLHEDKAILDGDIAFKKRWSETTEQQRALAQLNIEKLLKASEYLAEAEKGSGPIDTSRLAFFLPSGAIQTIAGGDRVKAMNEVRSVIQQSLRQSLGAQFTQKEGEEMMNRAFNPLFNAEANFGLIRDQLRLLESAAKEQNRAFNYYNANRTIFGFQPNSDLIAPDGSPSLVRLSQIADSVTKSKGGKATPTGSTMQPATQDQIETATAIYLQGLKGRD